MVASSSAWGASSQCTLRPCLARSTNPASSSTRRCFMKPGSDMPCGPASSLTVAGPRLSCSSTPRRVLSARAQNTRSRTAASAATVHMPGKGCNMLSRLPSVSRKAT